MSVFGESGLAGGRVRRYSGGEGVAVGLLRAFRWAQRMPRLVGPGLGEGWLSLNINRELACAVVKPDAIGAGSANHREHARERAGHLKPLDCSGLGPPSRCELLNGVANRGARVAYQRDVFNVHVLNLLLLFRSCHAVIIACCKHESKLLRRISANLADFFQLDTWRARMEAGA